MNILDIELDENDADAYTIGEYLKKLLFTVWVEEEGFSGKRPFGNSGWKHTIYDALKQAGVEGDYELLIAEGIMSL